MSPEISDVVAEVTKAKEARLREEFDDTLGKGVSCCGISVLYNECVRGQEETRAVVGVPYEISYGNLILGPYLKDIASSVPEDYHQRKMSIPIRMIISFNRLRL
ncbi:MAG: hypothetical protein AABX71_02840 [Nanoarchaeota archaeon]